MILWLLAINKPQEPWPSLDNPVEDSKEMWCQVKLWKVTVQERWSYFFGETFTTSCCKPDKSKVSAITAMPPPTNKKQVQSFIRMTNYLSKFSPRLSEIVEPIRELSKGKVPFNWSPEHQSAFTQMKREIASALVLAYYNPKKQTVLQIELLAVAWVMEKFHHILYACHFILETDQEPLEAILWKSINQAAPRLQRLLIRTFPYHFTVWYIPGMMNQLADYMST